MTYYINGLHCQKCTQQIEEKLNEVLDVKIYLDYEAGVMKTDTAGIPTEMKRLLDLYKIHYHSVEASNTCQADTASKNADHGHQHHHDSEKNMGIVFGLNLIFSLIELIFGQMLNSAMILTDAVHDAGDAASIGVAWYLERVGKREADEQYSLGYRKFSLLGALITASLLLVGAGIMIIQNFSKLFDPSPVHYQGMFWLGLVAIAVKLGAMWLMRGPSGNNEKLLNIHMLEDLLGWIAVVLVSVVLMRTEWYVLDPLMSMGIAGFIIVRTVPLFIETFEILLDKVPDQIDMDILREKILSLDGIEAIAHFHIWSMDGQRHVATLTILTAEDEVMDSSKLKWTIRELLVEEGIVCSTIEVIE